MPIIRDAYASAFLLQTYENRLCPYGLLRMLHHMPHIDRMQCNFANEILSLWCNLSKYAAMHYFSAAVDDCQPCL